MEIASQLKSDDFYYILYAGLFEVIKSLILEGREINTFNIVAEATKYKKIIEALGGENKAYEGIEALRSADINPQEYQFFVNEIKKYSLCRQITDISERIVHDISENASTLTLEEVYTKPQKLFLDIFINKKEEGCHISDDIEKYLDVKPEDRGKLLGIPSKFPSVNRMTLGYQSGLLFVYHAPTYEGKSILLLNEANHIGIDLNIPTLLIDTEMLKKQQQPRLLSMRTEIPPSQIKTGQYLNNKKQTEKIRKEIEKIKQGNLFFVSVDDFNEEELERVIRYYIIKHKIQIVFFDYIKIPVVKGRDGLNETQKIGNLVNFLKNGIAKKFNIAVIAACQSDEWERNRPADSQRIKRFVDALANWRKKPSDQLVKEKYSNGIYEMEWQKDRESEEGNKVYCFDFVGKSSKIIEVESLDAEPLNQERLFDKNGKELEF